MKCVRELEDAGAHVVAASGGYCHTLVLEREGRIFSLGCGEDGQRGDGLDPDIAGANEERPVATLVTLPGGRRCTQVSAGLNHSLALAEDGSVWAWGSNEYGQLGLPGDHCRCSPIQVPLDQPAVQVNGGSTHSAILGKDGRVYTMGNGDNGQLGNGSDEPWETPEPHEIRSMV